MAARSGWWVAYAASGKLTVTQGTSADGAEVNGMVVRSGPYKTRAAAQAAMGGGHPAPPGGGGGPPAPRSDHGPDVAAWLTTPLCRTVAIPRPGDLAIWGPNAHMGIVISATEMISALKPALGTRVTSIATAHSGIPVYRRLLATEKAGTPGPGGGGQAQNTARLLLPRYGWGASQFGPLVKLIAGESGWSATARNPNSGALGIGQALGHGTSGTAGTLGNEYGPQYGLSDAQAQAANSGDALQQIRWTLGYIKARYGSPSAAYAAWQARTPHWY